jgi:hypothetical protein
MMENATEQRSAGSILRNAFMQLKSSLRDLEARKLKILGLGPTIEARALECEICVRERDLEEQLAIISRSIDRHNSRLPAEERITVYLTL